MGVRIREKPKGSGEWYVFINHQGKRKSKKIGRDEKLAREVAEKIKAKLVLNELDVEKINKKSETFKGVAEIWLRHPHDWKESTYDNYQMNLTKHALPYFGSVPINDIKRKDLKVFFDKKYSEGLSVGTIKLIRTSINGVLSYAIELELIESNPMRDVVLKYKKNPFEINPLTESEAHLVLEQTKGFMEGKYYPVILCALRTGMRIGEIQALKWDDIDFENRQIEVQRSYRKGQMTDTKNHKRRKVDMSLHLTETLKAHRTAQKRDALKNGKPISGFVFTGKRDEMLNRSTFRHALNKSTEVIGRHIRTHNLRHSYATIRLMKGHNIGDVSYQLGHSSIKITYDVYAHWVPGKFKAEVDELDGNLSAPQVQPQGHPVKYL
jgi:integrase